MPQAPGREARAEVLGRTSSGPRQDSTAMAPACVPLCFRGAAPRRGAPGVRRTESCWERLFGLRGGHEGVARHAVAEAHPDRPRGGDELAGGVDPLGPGDGFFDAHGFDAPGAE